MNRSTPALRTRRRVALIAAILANLPFPLAAQEGGDVTEGRHVAAMWCSSCHIIGQTTRNTGANGVPTFASVARRPTTTPTWLRSSFLRPHPQIQNMRATPDEVRDLTAYIMSLRGR